eukprot:399540_1
MATASFEKSLVLTTVSASTTDLVDDGACVCIVADYDFNIVKCIDIEETSNDKFIYRTWDKVFSITVSDDYVLNESNTKEVRNEYKCNIENIHLAIYPQTTTFYAASVLRINETDIEVQFVSDRSSSLSLPKYMILNEATYKVTVPSVFVFNKARDIAIKKEALHTFNS